MWCASELGWLWNPIGRIAEPALPKLSRAAGNWFFEPGSGSKEPVSICAATWPPSSSSDTAAAARASRRSAMSRIAPEAA